jgi:hypothetical protein
MTELFQMVSAYAPRDEREAAFYQQLLQALTRLYDARKERIFVGDEGIADTVWLVTLTGSVLTICFALVFGVENRAMHFMLACFLAVSMSLVFALIALFDKPFQGGIAVKVEPYRLVRQQLSERGADARSDVPYRIRGKTAQGALAMKG